jgi:hypothetical protein
MSDAGDLANFETFYKHVKAKSDSYGAGGVLIFFALFGVGFMFYMKNESVGDLDQLSIVEQYFLTVYKGEFNPVWWLLAWAPSVLIPLAIVIPVVRYVRRPARLRPLYQDFLARGYVARIHPIGMRATHQDTNRSTPLAAMQGPHLDDAQFETAAKNISEVVAVLDKAQKQAVSNAFFFGPKPRTRWCRDASEIFPSAPAGLLLTAADFKERQVVYIPGASSKYEDVYPIRRS